VIEEKIFTRVGNTKPTSVDVRIIAATNRDLMALVRAGGFREDLYYRLNVIPIHIPPLRMRREDIPALAMNILEKFGLTMGYKKRMEPEVLDSLLRYDYPGNVRELINLMERMIIMSDSDLICQSDLPRELKESEPMLLESLDSGGSLKGAIAAVEARLISAALHRHGTVASTARALSVHPTTLWRKMARYGMEPGDANKQ
jgi:transcriptional regulator with PAS, ATPase and Fis domain